MIEDGVSIVPGMLVRHDEGLHYRVDDRRQSTVNYETAHKLGGWMINYTQMERGQCDPGTLWTKDEEGFRRHFTVVQEQIVEQG